MRRLLASLAARVAPILVAPISPAAASASAARTVRATLAATLALAAASAACAAGGTGTTGPDASLYWYDGGVRRPLQVDADHVARFGADTSRRAADVIVPAALAAKDDSGTGARSPVLRDASGAPRALPGGVIVTLPPDVASEADARARLAALGVQPVRSIGAGARVWLVAAEAGLPSLQLANRLHESGAVTAQPNWWQPRATK